MKNRLFIGVVTTECYRESQRELLRGIISQAFRASCDICVIAKMHRFKQPESDYTKSEDVIYNLVASDRFDGFIYDRDVFGDEKLVSWIDGLLEKSRKPVILLGNTENRLFDSASVDDSEAFEKITDHLIDVHGYRKIYCLTGPKGVQCSEERLNGYFASMKKHRLPYDKSYYFYGDFWKRKPAELAGRIISGDVEKPEAIVCGNDAMAAELCNIFKKQGIDVPGDIAVTGYDGFNDNLGTSVTVTTYRRPHFQLGAEALRRLYRMITGKLCTRIQNEKNEIIPGQSCGCAYRPRITDHKTRRRMEVEKTFSDYMLHSSMLIDICNIEDLESVLIRTGWYSYLIYKLGRFGICLTEKYLRGVKSDYTGPLTFGTDEKMQLNFSKIPMHDLECSGRSFDISEIVPDFIEPDRKHPSAYYVSLLHNNYNYFGYALLSFGKNAASFDPVYLYFIKYLNTALEVIYRKNQIRLSEKTENSQHFTDSETGFLNYRGLQSRFLDSFDMCSRVYALIETDDMLSLYIPSSPNSPDFSETLKSVFSESINDHLSDGECAAVITEGAYFMILDDAAKPEKIFDDIVRRLSAASEMLSCPVTLSLGIYNARADDRMSSLKSALYHARAGRVKTYTNQRREQNPQRDKLEKLRSRMMKHPEETWKIDSIADELYLSKSYLQKLYRETFGKSIIEELIQFRTEKACELLVTTPKSISEIAFDCGYSSYTYFTRQFSDLTGMSPSEYRKNNKMQ